MPPKKNNDKTTSSVKKPRAQKTNVKKEKKPHLKIPTVIRTKLKLPGRNPLLDSNESARLDKHLSKPALTQAKLDLANEVSRLQLIKPKEEEVAVPEETLPKPKPRGRKKAVVADTKNGIKDAGGKKVKLVRKKNETPVIDVVEVKTECEPEIIIPPITPKPRGRKKRQDVTEIDGKEAVAKKRGQKKKKKEPVPDGASDILEASTSEEVPLQTMATRNRVNPTPVTNIAGSSEILEASTSEEVPLQAMATRNLVNPTPVTNIAEATAKTTPSLTRKRGRPVLKKTEVHTNTTPKQMSTRKRPAESASDPVQAPVKQIETTDGEPKTKRKYTKKQVQSEGNVATFPQLIQKNDIARTPSEQSRCSSVNSCFSWTKDISNSSTTTCITVSHTDFVCIDKKLPIIQLYNINNKYDNVEVNKPIENERHSLSESEIETDRKDDESSSSSSSCSVSSLDLSTSSTSQAYSVINKQDAIVPDDSIAYALEKMTAKLNTFDLDIIEWIGHDTEGNVEMKKFQEKVLNVLKHENEIIMHCNNLQRVLSEDIDKESEMEMMNDDVFVKPTADVSRYVSDKSEDDDIFTSRDSRNKSLDETYNSQGDSPNLKSMFNTDIDFGSVSRRVSLDQNYNDDDDALSLYAESFTMESRISTAPSIAHSDKDLHTNLNTKFDEYVPESINKPSRCMSYKPTKIDNIPKPIEANKTKLVCEKQNADSTSINRDTDQYKVPFVTPTKSNFETINTVPMEATTPKLLHPPGKQACLLISGYSPMPAVRSIVFRGVCFFNLIKSCKRNSKCKYPHISIEFSCVKERLKTLTEVHFIQEYLLLRMWPLLRRRYGIFFLEECIKRELTRVLIEMTLDFVMKTMSKSHEDTELMVQVVEQTLIYLNQIDLTHYRDLLNYNVSEGVLLCDVLMKSIAETQNFSRFKQVFTNLTNFMIDNKRAISLDVATHILERVCILPCEEPLYRTLLKILNNTDNAIFSDPMILKFEQNISQLSSDLYGQYLLSKGANLEMSLIAGSLGTLLNVNTNLVPEQMTKTLVQTEVKRYTSPDTTKIDNMKPTSIPRITRTIVNNQPHTVMGNNDQQTEQNRSKGALHRRRKQNFLKPWGAPTKHVNPNTYGRSPPKFPRRSGPADYH